MRRLLGLDDGDGDDPDEFDGGPATEALAASTASTVFGVTGASDLRFTTGDAASADAGTITEHGWVPPRRGWWARRHPPVPVAGHAPIGKRRVRVVPSGQAVSTGFAGRFGPAYDTEGPRVTLGVVWFAAAVGALVVGVGATAPLFAAVAGLAGWQVAVAWWDRGIATLPALAAIGAAAVAIGAGFGAQETGLMVVAVALAAVAAAVMDRRPVASPAIAEEVAPGGVVARAGTIAQAALVPGLAAAGVVLTLRLGIGAAIALVLLVSAYEVGDYLIGSGASSSLEGPIAGIIAIGVVSLILAGLRAPPFDGADLFVFAGFVAVGCPLGQVAASALLPARDAYASGLRRLDSLVVVGPLWALLVAIYLQGAG